MSLSKAVAALDKLRVPGAHNGRPYKPTLGRRSDVGGAPWRDKVCLSDNVASDPVRWSCSDSLDNDGSSLEICSNFASENSLSSQAESPVSNKINGPKEEINFIPLDPERYKTELCRSFKIYGKCKYGNRCNYAHGVSQLRVSFRHGKYKTRNCQSYHETGICRYGARCSFIHDIEEGIMKCAISDRESLESLHFCPMIELRQLATVTWNILGLNIYEQMENDQNCETVVNDQRSADSTQYDDNILKESYNKNYIKNEILSFNKESEASFKMKQSKILVQKNSFSDISSQTASNHFPFDQNNAKSSECFSNANASAGNLEIMSERISVSRKNLKIEEKLNNGTLSIIPRTFKLDDLMKCLKTDNKKDMNTVRNTNMDNKKLNLALNSLCKTLEENTNETNDLEEKEIKYKTELCRSYEYNKFCEYNDACLYAHGKDDLRRYPKHPRYKTKQCSSFHRKGFCPYGNRCQFLHDGFQ